MKRIRIIAIISAIVTALAVYLYLASVKKPEAVQRAPVVVATQQISAGKVITADMIAVKNLPVEAINGQAARSVDEVVGRVSSADVAPDEQMLVSRFYRAGEANGTLAYSLENGKRAMTVQVDPVSGISGLIKPRDHVDVLVMVNVKEQLWRLNAVVSQNSSDVSYSLSDPTDQAYSLLPLQNLLVLATGQVMQANATDKETTVEQVTLSVTPDQAVTLNYCASVGQIKLILRSPTDTEIVTVQPKDISDIITINTWQELLDKIKAMSESNLPTPKPGSEPTPKPTATPKN